MGPRRALHAVLLALAALQAGAVLYLLALLATAARGGRKPAPSAGTVDARSFAIIVPAHDEEQTLGTCLSSLRKLHTHGDQEVIVVADNCSDGTARLATEAGVAVWERHDPARTGKGQALTWALERLATERPSVDTVAIVDADCSASPNLLEAMARRMSAGAEAVQVRYETSNPAASPQAALRHAAFALVNDVRPRGKTAVGLSCGLLGTGMGFTRDLLVRVPWRSFGLTEDQEQHLRIVAAGERVVFAAEASVTSPMPTDNEASDVQQGRWERGRLNMARQWAPTLLGHGVRRHDVHRLHAGLELLLPPQALLFTGELSLASVAAAVRARGPFRLCVAALGGHALFVLGGLALAGAPRSVYRALPLAPVIVLRKVVLYVRIARGHAPSAWIRTPRPVTATGAS